MLLMSLMTSFARRYAGAALPAKKNVRGTNSHIRVLAQPVVENDDVQRVQQLPLVFVDALHVAVEDRLRIDHGPGRAFEPRSETLLGFALGGAHLGAEGPVVG